MEGGGRGLIQVVFWYCLEARGTKKIVAIAGVVSENRTEKHPNTRVECYQYSSSSRVSFRVNTKSSQGVLTSSPPTRNASYINYLQPQHKTRNQLHRQLVPLWCNVGRTDTTDKLITRTTDIAACSFDSLLARHVTLRTKNYRHLIGGKRTNSFQYEIKAVE
jgi:hypothetical protein